MDSSEKGYIYECRAVIVKWDNGRKSVLITDIPRDLVDASDVTKRYVDRWPMQEKQFRDGKSGVTIHRMVGYGKKIETYEKMGEKHAPQIAIEKEHKDDLKRLKRYLKEEMRIRDKDNVYRIDTELGQIMTCFKLSFVNLCSLFLTKCMDYERFEVQTLFESIFQLGGNALMSDRKKTIELEVNPKEPKLMAKLEKGLCILNAMDIHDLTGRSIKFTV